MAFQHIKLALKDNIALLTLSHPEVLNAVSLQMICELNQVMGEIEGPSAGARCLLITGEGRGFCAGANLTDVATRIDGDVDIDAGEVLEKWYNPFFLRLRDLNMPIVTSVNGPAAGMGMSLALMGDMVLAARSTFFLQAFRHIGMIPDCGVTFILPRLIGWSRAKELSLMGERISAEKALAWGMISRVYDDDRLMPEAWNLAQELATGPTRALSFIRQAYWKSIENTYEEQLSVECAYQKEAKKTEDFKEGMSAFLQKRPAQFKGR
jgi:2-(1,2-epoxy-1,2-dihydrophenyl)acetyl-CoA isomerase